MDEYAELTIVFLANPEDLETLIQEAALNVEYTRIADDLNAWLKQRLADSPLKFRLDTE